MSEPGLDAPGPLAREVSELPLVRRALRLRAFQFSLVLPTLAVAAVVTLSAGVGVEHPALNFGVAATWVVWWGALLVSLLLIGRGWCLVCPLGTVGEWLQRLSLWWRSSYTAGLERPWPRRLRSMWPATALFVLFVFLDSGYGVSNSPRMTAGLVVALALAAAWVGLVFERRTFCRYLCPLTAFIGLGALASPLELRRRAPETCRTRCPTKDCFRGNLSHYGCPMGEYPGGGMDSNLYCILCTECLKSCPGENIVVRLRVPGRDLWEARRPGVDAAVASAVIVGLATVVPFLLVVFLPDLRGLLSRILPAGVPPNDPPRLAAVGLLFALGIASSVGLLYGASHLGRWVGHGGGVSARALFTGYAWTLLPAGLAKMLGDLLDHALRTWGALSDVTRALLLDFPLNRVMPDRVTAAHALAPLPVYEVQVALLLGGLLWSLFAMRRVSTSLGADGEVALASFVPMAGLALVLTLVSLWTLGMSLL